jgi:hypothetical protein
MRELLIYSILEIFVLNGLSGDRPWMRWGWENQLEWPVGGQAMDGGLSSHNSQSVGRFKDSD